MVRTASTMLPLGTRAPDFALPSVHDGRVIALKDFAGAPATLVMIICNHCPYVKHVAPELARIGVEYAARGVAIIAIAPNDAVAYPDDAPAELSREAQRLGYTFAYVHDDAQSIAKAYHAACTPEFYLFDAALELVYRGQLDGSRPNNGVPLTGADLRAALEAVLNGTPVTDDQYPGIGCNIKWKSPPVYFKPVGVT
jgi:peroxiredoxin